MMNKITVARALPLAIAEACTRHAASAAEHGATAVARLYWTRRIFNLLLLLQFATSSQAKPESESGWWTAALPGRALNVASNGETLWVCGTNEFIASSEDGGKTWKVKHQIQNGEILLKIAFADKTFGFASGTHGAFLRTTDGGETWKASFAGDAAVRDISFADERYGMRELGFQVQMTDDAGEHWSSVPGVNTDRSTRDYFEIQSFVRLDSKRAAIAMHKKEGENYFLVTRDGGASWKTVHIDNTFAGELFSRNSEYWAFGIEYLEREKGGGYGAPVVLHSSDGVNWSHGVRAPNEFSSCGPQGCVLYDGAIIDLYGDKPKYLKLPADRALGPVWATAQGSVCIAGAQLVCVKAERVETPPVRPEPEREVTVTTNSKPIFEDCIYCPTGSFPIQAAMRAIFKVEVGLGVGKDGAVIGADVSGAPNSQIRSEIRNMIGGWLLEPPRKNGVAVETRRNFSFQLVCFGFPGREQSSCTMVFAP